MSELELSPITGIAVLHVMLLADGAPARWTRLDHALNRKTLGAAVYRLVDFWRLLKKLGKAIQGLYGDARAGTVLKTWCEVIGASRPSGIAA